MGYRAVLIIAGLLSAGQTLAQDAAIRDVRESMVETAGALLATMEQRGPVESMIGADRSASLSLTLDSEARENWQFWPAERVGLPLELMTGEQRALTHDLLTSILSSTGYLKVVHIMQLEQILDMLDEDGLPRSVDHYVLVFFGTPSADSAWSWRFEGHHVSLNVAVSPDGVTVTPSFLGSNPAEVRSGPLAGFRVHGIAEDLARELVMSFDDAERRQAIIADQAPAEIFTANLRRERSQWDAWRESLQPEGVRVADLNEVQQHWVRRILGEAIGNYRSELATAEVAKVDIDELRFAWAGSTERRQPHYFRLQGPDFVYEYDNVQNMGNHVHAVWRSKSGDFGAGILERHYQSAHRE
jgi:hypothetical protein